MTNMNDMTSNKVEILFMKPMVAHDQAAGDDDLRFQKNILEFYHLAKDDGDDFFSSEQLGNRNGAPDMLRLDFLEQLPEASLLLQYAEEAAYSQYAKTLDDLRRRMEKKIEWYGSRKNEHSPLHNQDTDLTDAEANEVRDAIEQEQIVIKEYEGARRKFCFNLKVCYPMYATAHVAAGLREVYGKYYCPCGKGGRYWRRNLCGLPFQVTYELADVSNVDYCDGVFCFDKMIQLMAHLHDTRGPLHRAAFRFLKVAYHTVGSVPRREEIVKLEEDVYNTVGSTTQPETIIKLEEEDSKPPAKGREPSPQPRESNDGSDCDLKRCDGPVETRAKPVALEGQQYKRLEPEGIRMPSGPARVPPLPAKRKRQFLMLDTDEPCEVWEEEEDE
jgi:hypothetical protein